MRDRLLRLDQPPRDDLAHVVVRDDLVAAGFEQRPDLVVGQRLAPASGAPAAAAAGASPLPDFAAFDVARDDAPMRARALDAREIDAGLLGQPRGERRGEDAVRAMIGACRPTRALGALLGTRGAGSGARGAFAAHSEPRRRARSRRTRRASAWSLARRRRRLSPAAAAAALTSSPSSASTAIS